MIIAVDIDNVLNNLTERVLEVYNKRYNDSLTVENITKYSIESFVKPECKDDFPKLFLDPEVWNGISVIPDCVEVLKKYHDLGHEIYIVTATETENIHPKSEWLQRVFPFLNIRNNLICIKKKQMLGGNIDILIDDCLDNLIGGDYIRVLLDYPWNRNLDNGYRKSDMRSIFRCNDWKAINHVLKKASEALDNSSKVRT